MLLIFCNVTVFCVTSNTFWKEAEFKQIKWDMKPLFDCCCYCCLLLSFVVVGHQDTKIYNQLFLLDFITMLIEKRG